MKLTFHIIIGLFLFSSAVSFAQEFDYAGESEEAERLRAESQYDSALAINKLIYKNALQEGNLEYLMTSSIHMGSVFLELRELDVARDYYLRAISIEGYFSGKEILINKALMGVGGTFHAENFLDSALYYYGLTQQGFIDQGDPKTASALLTNMASIYYLQATQIKGTQTDALSLNIERSDKAYKLQLGLEAALKSNKLKTEIEDQRGLGRNNRLIGRIFREKRLYDSAQLYFDKAFNVADSLGYKDDARAALIDLSYLSTLKKDYKKAYGYRIETEKLTQEIFEEGKTNAIFKLREEYRNTSLELEKERQESLALAQKRYKTIILITSSGLIIGISALLIIVNQRRKSIQALSEKNELIAKQKIDDLLQEQEISSLQGILEGQETERKRVAMDLHDRLGGILSMVKLHFSSFEEKIDDSNPNKSKFEKASELLDQATKEVRHISHDLMSGVLTKFGIVPALEELAEKISSTGQIKINLYTSDLQGTLDSEQEIQVYRIVQELISNILKHAKASEANIQLNKNEDSINLIVEDDGVGFDYKNQNGSGGIGLINLKARVSKLNGSFHVDSGRGAGTTISIDIPISND